MPIKIRQNKYLNNIIEQDRRALKRTIKPMMGFKNFDVPELTCSPSKYHA
ncbi:integrase catalytic region [Caballeronia calidae]|uniref:Integrase catalytic region n=1 Tax=Caballeronia calidae TaxID=1777139 RepID=A0A158EJU0_9BURK|nr:integrase catalytic region [Caballeronia calidae]